MKKRMKKYPLIGFSIIAVVLLILTSFSNVVGFQTVQSSNQSVIKERINQRELVFQTICDIANNKEIQRIILKSQMSRGIFPNSDLKFSLTKQQLKQMYFIGLLLSKVISKSRIQSMVQQYKLINPEIQQEMNAIIEKDATLKEEITQLSNLECDCENEGTTGLWHFPIICTLLLLLLPLYSVGWWMFLFGWRWDVYLFEIMGALIVVTMEQLIGKFQCWWLPPPNNFPFISDISPANGEQNVLHNLTELSFRLTDHEGDLMSYKVTTSPYIGEGNGTLVPNGTYAIPVHGLQPCTSYSWELYLWQGEPNGTSFAPTFTFATAPIGPVISNPIPKHNASYVPISTSYLSFNLMDYQGNLMNWTVETQPNIGSGGAHGVGNGRYTVAINGLEYEKKYTWFVNVTDGTNWTRKTYVFTTTSEGLLVFEPSADTWVYSYEPGVNWGSGRYIEVYNDNRSWGMVLFNLSGIPAGSTIISANLSLFYFKYNLDSPVGREITCHRILENWNEMTVTFDTMPISDPVECASMIVPGNFTWVNWNVTSEVNDFINHGAVNYGWMLRDYKAYSTHNIDQYYYSSNADDLHPRLFVWFNSP